MNKIASKQVYTYCTNTDPDKPAYNPIKSDYKRLKTRKELLLYLAFHNSLDLGENFVPPFA
jgi:hypothetical protein